MMMEWLWPLAVFAAVSCITPGPNNLLLTQSGARFGFRRSVPHVCGIAAGMGVMLLAVASGLGSLFNSLPWLQQAMRIGGTLYLLWLGYMIAIAPPLTACSGQLNPDTLLSRFSASAGESPPLC